MKLYRDFIEVIEPNFKFSNKPINRFKAILKDKTKNKEDKITQLAYLKKQINSIENCSLKDNSKNIVIGSGKVSSPIMLIGEAPGSSNLPGEVPDRLSFILAIKWADNKVKDNQKL